MFSPIGSATKFAVFSILVLVFIPQTALSKPIGPNDPCTGIASVSPGLYGAIFVSEAPGNPHRFRRAGYLPTGAAIVISEPASQVKARSRRQYCQFNYRGAISGYIERSQITSVTDIAKSAGFNISEIAGFVGAANSNPKNSLIVYRTKELSLSDKIAEIGRSDSAIILLLSDEPPVDSDGKALAVRFIADPDNPILVDAYIATDEDRRSNPNGTFRIYKPTSDNIKSGTTASIKKQDWSEYFGAILSTGIGAATKTFVDQAKATLADFQKCGIENEYSLNASLKAGFGPSLLSISASGSSTIKWKKEKGEVEQLYQFGERDDIHLTIRGIATCKGPKPAFLKQAHVVMGGATSDSETRSFLIERDEFFGTIGGDPIPANIERTSSRVNLKRDMSILLAVPRIDGETSAFYYTLFDRIDRYLANYIIETTDLDVPNDDRFTLLLMIIGAFSYWD